MFHPARRVMQEANRPMRAVQVTGPADRPVLVETDVPRPTPGENEVLIQVHAAGVTPAESLWYPTSHNKDGSTRSGAIPGHEFSGVVAAVGDSVTGFSVGEEVYGMNDWFIDGATAEFCVAAASSIVLKPSKLTHAQAGAVPIGALTAWQGLVDRAKLKRGERVLVHGGAGAVGVFAVQLARLLGAEIITTVSTANLHFVTQLGARQAIDYTTDAFEKKIHAVDVVFDCVGGETLARSWSVLKPGGRMVTIASNSEATSDQRIKDAFFIVEPSQKQLVEVGKLLDQGRLRVFVDTEVPLSDAPAAYSGKVARKHGYGKTVVVLPANPTP
jgi:NADPH:quinone reductase-like Zn-dependent oxidoreductase